MIFWSGFSFFFGKSKEEWPKNKCFSEFIFNLVRFLSKFGIGFALSKEKFLNKIAILCLNHY